MAKAKKNANLHVATYEDTCKQLENLLVIPEGKKVVIRLGGSMPYANYPIQINSADGVKNSTDKLKMKLLFLQNSIPTSDLGKVDVFPVVVKGVKRSQGSGVFICTNPEELVAAVKKITAKGNTYYLETYFPAMREFRLHVSKWDGVFFAVEKMRNDGHVGELGVIKYENHYNVRNFAIPEKWEEMKQACIKALNVQNLDLAAYDVGYSANGEFVVYESNTGPELLKNTLEKYRQTLQKHIDAV